jgi:hypothetical protein
MLSALRYHAIFKSLHSVLTLLGKRSGQCHRLRFLGLVDAWFSIALPQTTLTVLLPTFHGLRAPSTLPPLEAKLSK